MIIDEKKTAKTVINKKCRITGNVESSDPLTILGEIQGNIKCENAINCSGKITGDVQGKEIDIYEATIQGNISIDNAISLRTESSIVKGDIKAKSCSSLGKIKGNCYIGENLSLRSGSILIGDVETNTLEMQQDACLSGNLNITRDANI